MSTKSREKVLAFSTNRPKFANALGEWIADHIYHLDTQWLERILEFSGSNDRFSEGLGRGLGLWRFMDDDVEFWKRITTHGATNSNFAFGLGQGIAESFGVRNKEQFERVCEYMKINSGFANGFALGYGKKLFDKDYSQEHSMILQLASINDDFAAYLGDSIGQDYSDNTDDEDMKTITSIIKSNIKFGEGFALGIITQLSSNGEYNQSEIIQLLEENTEIRRVFLQEIDYFFEYLDPDIQEQIIFLKFYES